jgi:hypothetical protein
MLKPISNLPEGIVSFTTKGKVSAMPAPIKVVSRVQLSAANASIKV